MYYIFHGEDELSRKEQIKALRAKMGDPQFAELNTTQLDGRKTSLGELQHACDSVPFLSDRRLVIVDSLLARLEPNRKRSGDSDEPVEEETNPDLAKELGDYLPRLPETTRLIFTESKTLAKNNPILKQASKDASGKKAVVREFAAPTEKMLPKWIQDRVKDKGATIEPSAVAELAAHVGADLRLLDNEIQKLVTYRANQTIRAEDVRTLVTAVHESDIFALVDAIGERKPQRAFQLLHEQLNHGAEPYRLLPMITRQFRLLLQMRDLAARGRTLDAAREQLKLHPFVAQKVWTQSQNFTIPQLETIYQRLLDTDIAIKTGRSEPVLSLDMLIVDLTN
jgi:DNA polymerase III subunit delta